MKGLFRWKYISSRIALLAIIGLIFLLVILIDQIYLVVHGQGVAWRLICSVLMMLFYLLGSYFWVILPSKKSEKLTDRFQEGHIMNGEELEDAVFLTPSVERQIEMVDRLFHSTHMMDLNKRQAQYLALQNQINPHFLYNTLESIRGEALIAGLESVAEMTEALAKFFRYTITKVENLVTVEEELENCETYFQIQQYRFGERLKLHIEFEDEEREEILNCKIPKLTLQPILENSIIHGTELKIGTGNLHIKFQRTEKRLIICISDDGVGMDEETLLKLNQKLSKGRNVVAYDTEEKQGGIALANVNNRIQLLFGEEYGMHIYSIYQKGTDVEITIPLSATEKELKNRSIVS